MKAIDLTAIMGKDASSFPEFYAGYFKSQGFDFMGIPVCVGPIKYIGQKALKRDIATLKAAMRTAGVKQGFLPVVAPASAAPCSLTGIIRTKGLFCLPWPTPCTTNTRLLWTQGCLSR